MHAETIAAGDWWARPRGAENDSWIGNYKNSLTTRHRDVIVAAVQSLAGVASILEVGSHCGPNLVRLARACPNLTELTGFDVNQEAIAAGRSWMQAQGLADRVTLESGRMPAATSLLEDGCVDVVLSCYALAYIAPSDVDAVLWEMGRVAKRAVILAEPMSVTRESAAKVTYGGYREWAHNYSDRSRWIGTLRGWTMTTRPVDPPVDRLTQILVAVRPTPSEDPTP